MLKAHIPLCGVMNRELGHTKTHQRFYHNKEYENFIISSKNRPAVLSWSSFHLDFFSSEFDYEIDADGYIKFL